MNEIQKTTPGVAQQPQQIEQVKPEAPVEAQVPVAQETPQTKEINEIPDNPADRSVVKADTLENDLKTFVDNPELAQKAMEIGELAAQRYTEAGVENPQEKALQVAQAFVQEFKN